MLIKRLHEQISLTATLLFHVWKAMLSSRWIHRLATATSFELRFVDNRHWVKATASAFGGEREVTDGLILIPMKCQLPSLAASLSHG